MSFSKIILTQATTSIDRSQEQVYLEGVKSLLTLVDLVIKNQKYSKTIKLFLCDYHLRNHFDLKELLLLPPYLLIHCLNAMSLKCSFNARLEHFMSDGETLIKEWQMSI